MYVYIYIYIYMQRSTAASAAMTSASTSERFTGTTGAARHAIVRPTSMLRVSILRLLGQTSCRVEGFHPSYLRLALIQIARILGFGYGKHSYNQLS